MAERGIVSFMAKPKVGARQPWWRAAWQVALSVVVAALGIWLGLALVGAADEVGLFDVVRVTLVLVVLELRMRPVLRLLAGRGSFLLALLLGIGGQLTVTALALALTLGSAWRTGARSPSSPARRRSSSRSGDGWSVPATRHMSSGTPPNCGGATTT